MQSGELTQGITASLANGYSEMWRVINGRLPGIGAGPSWPVSGRP